MEKLTSSGIGKDPVLFVANGIPFLMVFFVPTSPTSVNHLNHVSIHGALSVTELMM